MQIINLYRYEETNGVVVTPNKRNESDTPHSFRLIADEGKTLTNDNVNFCECIDVPSTDVWTEVEGTGEATEADYIHALEEVGVDLSE